MTSFRAHRPSAALVISVIALIAALSGTAYAAVLSANSVGTKQLKNNAVTNKKINNGAISTSKIKNGAITTAKLGRGAVTANQLNTNGLTVPNALHANSADSATNASTATSAATANSASTAAALTGVNFVQTAAIPNPANSQNTAQANCPSGQYVISGGVFGNGFTEQNVNSSYPIRQSTASTAPDAWKAYVNNTSSGGTATNDTFNVYAICTSGSASSSFAHSNASKR